MSQVRTTHRWRGVVAVGLVAGASGAFLRRPSLLLVGAVAVAFAAYPRITTAPAVDLELDRRVHEGSPDHGDPVEVTVTVHNAGDGTLADLRVVDGVPPMLSVTDGTPRHATALRPGESATFSYEVTAKHGTHWFDPATAIVRDVSGATEVETDVEAETAIECATPVPEVPLRRQTTRHVGRILTDDGGSGVEFHGTREYRRGDSLARVDWRRFAKTGELTTVEYREERVASVVLCVDARGPAYRARADDEPHAVSYGLAATEQLLSALEATPNFVGVAAIGREFCWLAPGASPDHVSRARRLLATHPALSTKPPSDGDGHADRQVTELRKRLDAETQVVLVSPLTDGDAAEAALELEAAGHSVTVVSPDVTAPGTVGTRLAAVERDHRITSLRESGVVAVDWDPAESLGTTLIETGEGMAR